MGQIILNGAKSIQNLKPILNELNCTKYLLVKDSSFPFLSIRNAMEEVDIDRVDFSEFTPNPLYEHVAKGIELLNREGCQAIVAIGGGSAIDVAKCIKLYYKMDQSKVYMLQEYGDTRIPLIAIPTTAGTGSESTIHAVIYWGGKKQSISHESILPNYAILDHSVLKTLPLYQKKCTMLDALCQGIESWWSVNSNDDSKVYSKNSVELIMKNWEKYIFDNDDEAAANIMEAANYSGRAICLTQTTAAHAMSYMITSLYNFPHGHAVAVCLPKIWEYMNVHTHSCFDVRGEEYIKNVFVEIGKAMGEDSVEKAVAKFCNMMERMDMKNPVADNREEELKMLTSSVNPIRLKNNPVQLDEKTLKSLYAIIVK